MTARDRDVLTTRAYGEPGPLAARASIYRWQRDPIDLPGLALERLSTVEGVVVDVGCGLGTYVARLRRDRPDLRTVGMDLSLGMRPDVVGDIQRLPLGDGIAGAALAMHMLYHVPNISAAANELRRIVRPGGVVLLSTNARDDKHEMDELWTDVLRDLTGRAPNERPDPAARFAFEQVSLLEGAFDDVSLAAYVRDTVVTDVVAVVAFVDSTRAFSEPLLPAGVTWSVYLDRAAQRIEATVAAHGAFHLSSHVGIFTCR